jgi:hypothetical protein
MFSHSAGSSTGRILTGVSYGPPGLVHGGIQQVTADQRGVDLNLNAQPGIVDVLVFIPHQTGIKGQGR